MLWELGACHFLDILYVLTEGGRVGRGRKRDPETDRKGQMKGESQRKRDLFPVYREQRAKETEQQAPRLQCTHTHIHTHTHTHYLPSSVS